MGRANLLAIFVLILSAALIPPSYAQSFTVTSDLGASSSPHVALQLAESNGYTSSVNAQVHLAAGATVNYQFSEIDWGDGSFTRGSAISTAQGETHTYPQTSTKCVNTGSQCSYTVVLLITDSNAASSSGTTYVSTPISSSYPSGGSPATTGSASAAANPTTTINSQSQGSGATSGSVQSILCSIVALLNTVLYTLALALFVIGSAIYTLAHTLPLQARGMMQGYGAGIMMGGITVAIIALIAPYILALFLGGGIGAASLC